MSSLGNQIIRLKNKVAIVTGSTQGIGFAIAKRLAQEGAKVIVSSRRQENVDEAVCKLKAEKLDVTGLVCHVSNPNHRKDLFETARSLGGLDILVSNVGANPQPVPLFETEESAWDKTFDVNVKASFLLMKEAIPLLKQRPSGRVVLVSSIGVYCISKLALLGLTKQAADQLAKHNITVNCIVPGLVKTNFSKVLSESEEHMSRILAITPMNRVGTPEEISGVAAFLVSEDASFITGETIPATGGIRTRI